MLWSEIFYKELYQDSDKIVYLELIQGLQNTEISKFSLNRSLGCQARSAY